ncbi:terminase small subunit [Buttiauxella sp. S19-1]|uniref:terminase small subunit n=1 Tax=Buttiauxella sp. S19-1 TaxID=941430 RepID=UPI001EDB3E7C|nr:terminase small subunit [Buttiauxella sp. S19-1]
MSKPDESELKSDYCSGLLSIQKVADKHGIAKSTLVDLAKKHCWERLKSPSKNSVQNINGRTVGRTDGRGKPSQKKSAKKKSENFSLPNITDKNDDPDNTFVPEYFGISEQQGIFAEHVAAGKPIVDAYRLAGYKAEGNAAYVTASQLLRNPKVARAIRWLRDKRQRRMALVESEIIHQLVSIANADPNALSQIRRVNCRYCWGDDHLYQWNSMSEYENAEEKASDDGKEPPEFGGVGYVDSAIPNPDCPKCFGEGSMRTFFADTTQLDGPDRWLFAGVKETMNGLEIKTANQDAARRELLRLAQANRGRLPGDATPGNPGKDELELERLRLGNEKLQVEIENIRNGKQESNLVVVHNALQIPGAFQPTQEGEGDD